MNKLGMEKRLSYIEDKLDTLVDSIKDLHTMFLSLKSGSDDNDFTRPAFDAVCDHKKDYVIRQIRECLLCGHVAETIVEERSEEGFTTYYD